MSKKLTRRQKEVLDILKKHFREKGYPPSVREICKAADLKSSSTVHAHLGQLEKKGYIRKDPTKPRAIEILDEPFNKMFREAIPVPVIGKVTAGEPVLAQENITEYIPLSKDFARDDELFILRVKGDSMMDAGIMNQDYAIIRQQSTALNGDITVVLLDNEATIKRFYKEKKKFRLQPENDEFEPILVNEVTILGKVVGLIRRL